MLKELRVTSLNTSPKVSIIIPVYNAEMFIAQTLDSILCQSYKNIEVILIDDCSTDNSKAAIEPFLSDNVKYYCELKNHGGPAGPRNTGIRQSSGELIMMFDSDDIMLPEKIEKSVSCMVSNPGVGLLCTGFQSIDQHNSLLKSDYLSSYQSFRTNLTPAKNGTSKLSSTMAYKALCLTNFVGTSSVVVPKVVFNDIGYFDESLKNSDDVDMWFRIAKRYGFLFIEDILHQYRVNTDGISSRGNINAISRIKVLEKQLKFDLTKYNRKALHLKLAPNYLNLARHYMDNNNNSKARLKILKSFSLKPTLAALKLFIKSLM